MRRHFTALHFTREYNTINLHRVWAQRRHMKAYDAYEAHEEHTSTHLFIQCRPVFGHLFAICSLLCR